MPKSTSARTRQRITPASEPAVRITIAKFEFTARFELDHAPQTCNLFKSMLLLKRKIIQARWSGEAAWVPLGEIDSAVSYENHTSHPAPGQLLFYSFGLSEPEILFPYGACVFASKVGQLAGNHFLSIVDGLDQLPALGRSILWEGAHTVIFALR